MKNEVLKQEVLRLLKEGHEITVTWDCGGDQSIIGVFIDGHEIRTSFYDHLMKVTLERNQFIVNGVDIKLYPKFDWELARFLLEEVDIFKYSDFSNPQLEGGGKIILQDDKVLIEFKTYRTSWFYFEPEELWYEEEEFKDNFEKMPDFAKPEERDPKWKLEIPLAQALLFTV